LLVYFGVDVRIELLSELCSVAALRPILRGARSKLESGGTSPLTTRRWTDTQLLRSALHNDNVESYTYLEFVRDKVRGGHAYTATFAALYVASPRTFLIRFRRTKCARLSGDS
jgi:hypothetical protein